VQQAFRFWGYGCPTYDALVGAGGYLRPHAAATVPVFGYVQLEPCLLKHAGPLIPLCESGWWSWLVASRLASLDDGRPVATLRMPDGSQRPIVSLNDDGAWCFGFDVDATLAFMQNEAYSAPRPPGYLRWPIAPHRLPSAVRKGALHALRLVRAVRRARAALFPAHCLDPAVDVWRWIIRGLVEAETADRGVALWPAGKQYAVVLTHDIDTEYSLRHPETLQLFSEIEARHGLRSAWMVVSSLLERGTEVLDRLHAAGHEIGFHDACHDHRLAFLPPEEMAVRLAEIEPLSRRYGTVGFRSPNYLHTPSLFAALGGRVRYDMTLRNFASLLSGTAVTHEGCSTSMPFFFEGTDVVEIPNTVPEDVTLELDGHGPSQAVAEQVRVVEGIRARQGVVNVITHPEPYLSARPRWVDAYRRLVDHLAGDEQAWIVCPATLCRHWRRRRLAIDRLWGSSSPPRSGCAPAAEPVNPCLAQHTNLALVGPDAHQAGVAAG
jgi:hypothetical protein